MDDPREPTDEVLEFLRGDPAQLASVQAVVRATVRSFQLADRELERDLVQEALSRTVAGLANGRFLGAASLRTYARNVARYTSLEHIRRRRREVAFDPELHPADDRWSAPEAAFLSVEEHRRNLTAFAALPEDCRRILGMICLEGASYREVASRLGLSEAALKSRIHRCRLTCRDAVKPAARAPRLELRKARS